MIFHLRHQKVYVPLVVENTAIKQIEDSKRNFFSVIIDQHISRKPHISFVSKTISKSVEIIAKARFYLS